MSRRLLLALITGVGLQAQEASPFTWYLTNDFLYQRNDLASVKPVPWGTPSKEDLRPNQFQESLALFGSMRLGASGELSAGTTLRSTNFYKLDQNLTLERRDDSIYRWFAKYRQGGFSLQAGDFHAMLGQGFVLSVVQNDALLRERTIRGGEARYQNRWLDARTLAGTVTTELRTEGRQQSWEVQAADLTVEYLKGNRIGVRGSRIEDTKAPIFVPLLGRRDTTSFNLAGSDLFGMLSYYGEYGRLAYADPATAPIGAANGHAVYGNVTLRARSLLLMAEHKRYANFDNGLNNLPLADREEELNDLRYSEGTRLFGQYHVRKPDLTFFASVGRYIEGPLVYPATSRRNGSHVYGGFRAEDLWDALSFSYSYGLRFVDYPSKKSNAHLTYSFGEDWSLEWTFKDKRLSSYGLRVEEQDLNTQLAKASWGALWILKQTSRERIGALGGTVFLSAGLRVNLKGDAYLELSGGKQRGGLVCSGGQCVTLPPFKGWRLAAHFTFK